MGMRLAANIIVLLLCLPLVLTINATGGGYNVPTFAQGVQAGQASASNYNATFITTTNPVAIDANGSSYEASIAFFGGATQPTPDPVDSEPPSETQTPTTQTNSGSRNTAPLRAVKSTVRLTTLNTYRFTFNNQEYQVRLIELQNSSATIEIANQNIKLYIGENITVDLDGDSILDYQVILRSLHQGSIELEFLEYTITTSVQQNYDLQENTSDNLSNTPQQNPKEIDSNPEQVTQKNNVPWKTIIFVVLLLIVLGVIFKWRAKI